MSLTDKEARQFVTYPWLVTTAVGVIGLGLTIFFFTLSSINADMDKKQDKSLSDTQDRNLCEKVDKLAEKQEQMDESIDLLILNQQLVLRALKIPPAQWKRLTP